MIAYAYQAALYCEDCAAAIKRQLKADGKKPSEDTDEWPRASANGMESDCPEHCASYADCLNAIELPDGRKIGAWLENELTADGAAYVREAVESKGEATKLWAEWYSYAL